MAAFDGNGNYVRSYNWVNDKDNGIDITASRMDTEFDGIAAALTNCVTRDGQGKLNVSATARMLGRISVGAGAVQELTAANVVSILTAADGSGSGLDSDLLDGQHGAFYQNAGNLNAGTIPNARVPLSAVQQYQGSLSVASAASATSASTATTQAPGTSNTTIATTAFVEQATDPGHCLAANGYQKFASGLILQWGYAHNSVNQFTTTFPLAFPAACFAVVSTSKINSNSTTIGANVVDSLTTTGFLGNWHQINTGPDTGDFGGYWIAIGH
jgi:hypothetical protein